MAAIDGAKGLRERAPPPYYYVVESGQHLNTIFLRSLAARCPFHGYGPLITVLVVFNFVGKRMANIMIDCHKLARVHQ